MIKAILFDLDNTLLGNDMATFLPRYFALCGSIAQRHLPREEFMRSMLLASRAMVKNTDPALSNNEVFWSHFCDLTALDRATVVADFEHFYRNDFEQLREVTEPVPVAAQVIDRCFQQGLQVVIATNPMFPRLAIEARLAWAGVPASDYDYDLITTIENMHATKPHQAYYQEILDRINCQPQEALMVGDDVENDIEPAGLAGLHTYWVEIAGAELPPDVYPTAQGSLADLLERIDHGWLYELQTAV